MQPNNLKKKMMIGLMVLVLPGGEDALAEELQSCAFVEVKVPYVDQLAKKNDAYFVEMLNLALEKTRDCGNDFEITYFSQKYSSKRFRAEVYKPNGAINVYWSMASEQIERDLLPIKVPLLKGMNGYRVLIIRKEDAEKFNNIHNLDELAAFSAGQGLDWPDVEVLRQNGIRVVTSSDSDLLYKMLSGRRFDFLPRGIHEARSELAQVENDTLMICDTVVLSYEAPVYFFVNKSNRLLADRIERGLTIAKQDGSFDALFNRFENLSRGYLEMRNSKRRKVKLYSPHFGDDD